MIAGRPDRDLPVPEALAPVIAGRDAVAIWRNEIGGLTFEMGADPDRCFIKWAPAGSGANLDAEADRLRWAASFTSVPRLIGQGTHRTGAWPVTSALAGGSAVSPRWTAEPARAVAVIGAGLRSMHDALPVGSCPFSWSANERVANAAERAVAGRIDAEGFNADHRRLGLDTALGRLRAVPPVDRLVVCHGDACAPNTLIADDGSWAGHVDLGTLGVADRWADLAVATWSTVWNYGPGWEDTLLAAYGVEPDEERTAFYRLLWDLGP